MDHSPTPAGLLDPAAALRRRLLASSHPSEIAGLLLQGARYDLSEATERERLADAFTRAAAFGNLPAMDQMLEAGADPDCPAPRSSARTALIYALEHGDEEAGRATALWLLERGASPDKPSGDGEPPLTVAAAFGRERALVALLEHGARVEAADRRGRTALARAALHGQAGCAAALLRFGADPLAAALDGKTPWQAASNERLRALLAAAIEQRAIAQSAPAPAPAGASPPKPRL